MVELFLDCRMCWQLEWLYICVSSAYFKSLLPLYSVFKRYSAWRVFIVPVFSVIMKFSTFCLLSLQLISFYFTTLYHQQDLACHPYSDPYMHLVNYSHLFSYGRVDAWNHLPSNIKLLTSLNSLNQQSNFRSICFFKVIVFNQLYMLYGIIVRFLCCF